VSVVGVRRYRRSPHLLLRWSGDAPILLHADTLSEFHVDAALVDVLARLETWSTAQSLADGGGAIGEDGLEALCRAGILEGDDAPAARDCWDPLELAVHRRTAYAGAPCPSSDSPTSATEAAPARRLALPDPAPLHADLGAILATRRTRRDYGERPLALSELSTLLHHAAGFTGDAPERARHRPFASAGARSELEIYVVANDVAGLDIGAWHYAPGPHTLTRVRDRDDGQRRLCAAMHDATGRRLSGDPPAILLVTAIFERVAAKYGHLALSLIYKDVGCLLQALYLVAAALELAPCGIGGGEDAAAWLGRHPLCEPQVGCFLVGPAAPS
jgi:SagB-type dehydrogenase family enzyme